MSHGHTRIATKGKCIYCGDTDSKLTDEHALPYFIGGKHVLIEASCKKCARITSKFERDVAKGMWDDPRVSYDSPSRRKKTRKEYVALDDLKIPGGKIKVPYSEYPASFIFYLMNTAGMLNGTPFSVDTSNKWLLKAITDEDKLQSFEKKYPGNTVVKFKHMPDSFARLIAKIGYCQVLCSLDIDDFEQVCMPYILGEKSNLSYIVGSRNDIPEPDKGLGYKMSTHVVHDAKQAILLAEIRLLANCYTPTYHVVVGRVDGVEAVQHITNKVNATYTIKIPDGARTTNLPDESFHWMPRKWPIQ